MPHSHKALYRIAGVAALLAVFVFRRNLGAELALLGSLGVIKGVPAVIPDPAAEWFNLFQANRLVGMTLFGVFDLVEYLLVGVMFLAVYAALRRVNPGVMLLATALGLIGITVYFSSNQAFGMLALSQKYTLAESDARRLVFEAAGEALLAQQNPGGIHQGTGITVSLFLVLLSGLIISVVMLRSDVFSKATAITGILANGIGMFYFIGIAFDLAIYWIGHPLSAPFRVIWYFLMALRLFKLGNSISAPIDSGA
jgi:hypothetical protein